MSGLFTELKRRNVFRVGVAYLALAWVVIEVTGMAVPALNLPDSLNSIVFYLGLIGFPFALFFAWAFELTPEGLMKTADVDKSQSVTHSTGRKLDFVIIGLLALALLFVVWDSYLTAPDASQPGDGTNKSIAVLPFVNMSSDAEQEYFSDGITEEILNALVAIDGLTVVGRTSSFAFKGKNQDLREIGKALGVDHLVEGSVRKAGVRVRTTAQLIRADTGTHLWSETYDRELTDIFAVQDEISAAIAGALKVALLGEAAPGPARLVHPEAYDLFLRARHSFTLGSFAAFTDAAELLEQALALDPGFLAARALMAKVLWQQSETGMVNNDATLPRAETEARAVLAADPDYADALVALAMISAARSEFEAADRHIDAAIAKGANDAGALRALAYSRIRNGELSGIQELLEKAASLDPLNSQNLMRLASVYGGIGLRDEAMALVDRAITVQPGNPNVYFVRSGLQARYFGDLISAIKAARQARDLDPADSEGPAFLAHTLLDIGALEAAEEPVRQALAMAPTRGLAHWAEARLLMLTGDAEAAVTRMRASLADPGTVHRWGTRVFMRGVVIDRLMRHGEFETAAAFLLAEVPDMTAALDGAPARILDDFPGDEYFDRAYWVQLLRAMGDEDRGRRIARHYQAFTLDALTKNRVMPVPEDHFDAAIAALAVGRIDDALARLEAAYDGGHLVTWQEYYRSGLYYALWEHPRYKALMARIEADVAAQLAALKAEDAE